MGFAAQALDAVARLFGERRRVRREIERVPMLEAGSPEGARVRVTGTVRVFEGELIAPLSGKRCVAYRARAHVWQGQHRKDAPAPPTTPQTSLSVPFVLDGPTETVLVDGDDMCFDLPATKLTAEHASRQASFLLLHGFPTGSARFKEIVLEPGAVVTVAGVMMRDVPLEPAMHEKSFREGASPLVRLTGSREYPLFVSGGEV